MTCLGARAKPFIASEWYIYSGQKRSNSQLTIGVVMVVLSYKILDPPTEMVLTTLINCEMLPTVVFCSC